MKNSRNFLMAIIGASFLVACGSRADDYSPIPTSVSAVPKATVLSPEERNVPESNAEYVISVSRVEDPASAAAAYKPKLKDGRLVAVEVTFENAMSKDSLDVNLVNLAIIDEKGLLYPVYAGARDGEVKSPPLKQGEKAMGWVAFEIPKEAKAVKVRYTVGLLTTVQLEALVPTD